MDDAQAGADIRSVTERLESAGVHVYYAPFTSEDGVRWQRVLAGTYDELPDARGEAERLRSEVSALELQVVSAEQP